MELRNPLVLVELDPRWPRLRRIARRDTGKSLQATPPRAPFSILLNDKEFGDSAFKVTSAGSSESVTYTMLVPSLHLELEFRYVLDGESVVFSLGHVREEGDFRLETVDLVNSRLITGLASSGDRYLRYGAHQADWSRSWVPGSRYDEWEETSSVAGSIPDVGARKTTYACVWNRGICATVQSSSFSDPLLTFRDPSGALIDGRAGAFVVQSAPLPYRLRGAVATPVELRIGVLGDYNRDGKVDWADAAGWLGDRIQPFDPYRETLIYKIYLDDLNCLAPLSTFDDVLATVERVHRVSGGIRQVVYLVGWQKDGHDASFPDPQEVNARCGGAKGLQALVKRAAKFNATVSVHTNVSDSYVTDPGYDPELLSRDIDGKPFVWFNNALRHQPVYSVNLTLAVENGAATRWIEHNLELSGAMETIHLDAFRPWSEAWLPNGIHIDSECESQRGLLAIRRLFEQRGIDVTAEGWTPRIASWSWFLPDWRMRFPTVMAHGRWSGFVRYSGGFLRSGFVEGDGLGSGWMMDERNPNDPNALVRDFYTRWMYFQILSRKKMTSLTIGEWDSSVEAHYQDDTYVWAGGSPNNLLARYEGIEIARGRSRFLPWRSDEIYFYSPVGGPQEWALPIDFPSTKLSVTALYDGSESGLKPVTARGRTIRFDADPGIPLRLHALVDSHHRPAKPDVRSVPASRSKRIRPTITLRAPSAPRPEP
jgi:hypothetical protein